MANTASANDEIQLEDMLESYPAVTSENFQTLITAKQEFRELASDVSEKLPAGRGKYFKHQRFTHRFLRAYDDLLILSETGTGKSCEVLGFTEYTRHELDKAKVDPSSADEKAAHFKRVIVLVKGPTQKNEFKNQLVCSCSDGSYETAQVLAAESEKMQKSNISRAIKQAGYIVKTYISFANAIKRDFPDESSNAALTEAYSDTIFWIDEAHNLLVDQDFKTPTEKQQTFTQIWRIFHLVQRSKRIISTATPMINDENEIGSLMNLILPVYQQFPTKYNFSAAGLRDLEPYFRGRVSFIRASDTGAVVKEVADPEQIVKEGQELTIDNVTYRSQLVVYASYMSPTQSEVYVRASGGTEKKKQNQLYGSERQASNFVFPDGWWGNGITDTERQARRIAKAAKTGKAIPGVVVKPGDEDIEEELEEEAIVQEEVAGTLALPLSEKRAFRRYVEKSGDKFSASPELRPWLSTTDNIRTLSCKYAAICDLVKNKPGNCFVYGEYVEGSGAIVLALCLEGLGFERYNDSDSMFLGLGRDTIKPFCARNDLNASTRRVKPSVKPKLRYALLTRDTTDAKFASMMGAMNSYENRNGEYIKVLIASRVGRDAISVSNVLQIHLTGSEWNQSAMYQAISRGIRATSHVDLIQDRVNELVAGGMSETEAKLSAKVDVNIYKHCAIPDKVESIDLLMYRHSENKDRRIKRIMRIMKQCAIGCQIHYKRNVRDSDVDGSAVCDYEACHYECVDPVPTDGDLTTYDVLYSGEVVTEALANLVNIYRQVNALSLETLLATFPQFRKKYLLMALEQLIRTKTGLVDRFGYTTYLREDNGSFYLDRNYPSGAASYAMSYYTNGIIAVEQKSLSSIVVELESGKNLELQAELEGMTPSSPEFLRTLNSMDITGQVSVLENALLRSARGESSAFVDAVLAEYDTFVITMHEPVTELNKLYADAAVSRPKVGRPVKVGIERRPKKINVKALSKLQEDLDSQVVYIHTLYSKAGGLTAYDRMARIKKGEGRRRILKTEMLEQGWQDIDALEDKVYNTYIQMKIAEKDVGFEGLKIYGSKIGNEFRIVDKLHESEKAASDSRSMNTGKICTTFSRPALIDIMWETKHPGVPGPSFAAGQERQLREYLLAMKNFNHSLQELESWDISRLSYYYRLHSDKTKATQKIGICESLDSYFESSGRMQK